MLKAVEINSTLIKDNVVARASASKKGDNGVVLIVGGSRIYHGAPILASLAAMRSGADLVYTAVPRSNIVSTRSISPDFIVLPLPDDKFTVGSANRLIHTLPKKIDAAAIGMGMTITNPKSLILLVRFFKNEGSKILLDASSLIPEVLPEISDSRVVITPHAGEFKRLFGKDPGIQANERIENVFEFAKKYNITILLKGSVDVISDGKIVAVNKTHNCAMTVGGTGDVLAGLTCGLLTKMEPISAAMTAAYFNGCAGNMAFKKYGLHITASDLIIALPSVMKDFDIIK